MSFGRQPQLYITIASLSLSAVVHSMRREEIYAQVDLQGLSDHSVLVDAQMNYLTFVQLSECNEGIKLKIEG